MLTIRELPKAERPRERFMHYGKEALAVHELIAIILRTGVARQSVLSLAQTVYHRFHSMRNLNQATVKDLSSIPGIGKAKAIQLLAALELGRRMHLENFTDHPSLHSPQSVYQYMHDELSMLNQEHFYALYLDTKGHLLHKQCLFIGSLNASLVHPREVFKHAVSHSAASIIVVHNHPSGDPTPSLSDLNVTKAMVEAGQMMDISLVDHIIIGKGRYHSFKEAKQMG